SMVLFSTLILPAPKSWSSFWKRVKAMLLETLSFRAKDQLPAIEGNATWSGGSSVVSPVAVAFSSVDGSATAGALSSSPLAASASARESWGFFAVLERVLGMLQSISLLLAWRALDC